MTPRFAELHEMIAFASQHLADALHRRGHPWRSGVLASVDASGADARVVVLRGADPGIRRVTFHTDRRSPKFTQILRNPAVSWVFYDPVECIQLRVRGTAEPASTAREDAAWATLAPRSFVSYATLQPPGTPQADGHPGLPESWSSGIPPREANGADRRNFAVIDVVAYDLDILSLRAGWHQRGKFRRLADTSWESTWLTP